MKNYKTMMMAVFFTVMFFQIAVAQKITNVVASQEKRSIHISYSLDKDSRVEAQYSLDGGKTFQPMNDVKGDVGDGVSAGNKHLEWNPEAELGQLVNSNVYFKLVPSSLGCGKLKDYEGNEYSTVIIGKRCLTRENMRTGRSNEGIKITLLPEYRAKSTPFGYVTGTDNTSLYGYLYNYKAATQVCPKGWHLPSKKEWEEMRSYLDHHSYYSTEKGRGMTAKSIASCIDWNPEQEQCLVGQDLATNNASGFSALPAGMNGKGFAEETYFWSSTGKKIQCDRGAIRVNRVYGITSHSSEIETYEAPVEDAYSVRCINDTFGRNKPSNEKERVKLVFRWDARKLFLVNATCQASALQGRKISIDDFTFGFMAGRYKFLGGYFSAMWNGKGKGLFRKQPAGEQWLGISKTSNAALTAGIVVSPCKNVNFYAGAGPSFSIDLKQSEGGKWFMDSKSLRVGAEVEAGVMFNFGGFALNFGVTTTNFKSLALKAGIGWSTLVKK